MLKKTRHLRGDVDFAIAITQNDPEVGHNHLGVFAERKVIGFNTVCFNGLW